MKKIYMFKSYDELCITGVNGLMNEVKKNMKDYLIDENDILNMEELKRLFNDIIDNMNVKIIDKKSYDSMYKGIMKYEEEKEGV